MSLFKIIQKIIINIETNSKLDSYFMQNMR